MSSIIIQIKTSRVKSEQSEIKIVCPFCNHILKNYDALRFHLTRHHKNELGYSEVYKQASKLWRLYKEARV